MHRTWLLNLPGTAYCPGAVWTLLRNARRDTVLVAMTDPLLLGVLPDGIVARLL